MLCHCVYIPSCSLYLIHPFPLPRSMPLSLTVPRPQFRFSNRLTACHPTPNLEGQSTLYIYIYIYTPGLSGLAMPLGTGHPIWSPFMTCMGCSETSFLRPPHGEIMTMRLVMCGTNRPNAGKIKNTRP
jgi:hypothetical protein